MNVIKEAREKSGLSVRMLAKLCDIDQSTVVRIENGQSKPSIRTLHKLCRVLKLNVNKTIKHFEN